MPTHLARIALALLAVGCTPSVADLAGPGSTADAPPPAGGGDDGPAASDGSNGSDGSDGSDGSPRTGEGTVIFRFGFAPEPGQLDCDLTWDVRVTAADAPCRDCDYVFQTAGDLTDGSYGGRDCGIFDGGDLLVGVRLEPRRGYSGIYLYYDGYYGSEWYPVYGDGTATPEALEWEAGLVDYRYRYEGATYYLTYWFAGDLTLPSSP